MMSSNVPVTLKCLKNGLSTLSKGALATSHSIANKTNAVAVATALRSEQFHASSCTNYPQADLLPMPNNIDQSETTRFSPQRSRDISSTIFDSHNSSVAFQPIDITVDQSADAHIGAYDCSGAVHLSSSMQSNVPNPFGGMNKFTHLNMPGGQWGQGIRLMANDMHSSHYTNLRQSIRSNWSQYDETINKEGMPVIRSVVKTGFPAIVLCKHVQQTPVASALTKAWHDTTTTNTTQRRMYSTGPTKATADNSTPITEAATPEVKTDDVVLSRKDKLKKAVKEYGSTVFVFHIGISLISLGSFYLLVSSGLDLVAIIDRLGWENTALSNRLAAGASTFVVAYAVHKVFAPVRISITLGATPFIVRYLRQKGILKPVVNNKKSA